MKRVSPIFITVLLFCATAHAQKKSDFLKPQPVNLERSIWKPYGAMSIASSAVCYGGVSADLATSRGLQEGNPLLRNANGSPNLNRAALIGFGSCSLPFLIKRKHPKAASIVRFVLGSVHIAVAIHNRRLR